MARQNGGVPMLTLYASFMGILGGTSVGLAMLDVSLPRARGILKDLVEREILVKVSEQQRGPGVEYGRGNKFPQRDGSRKAKR